MTKNKETLQAAMDRRLSFLDDLPSCRAAVQRRIAQEEETVMKKKISFGFVFAMILALLSAAALAAGPLISPRVAAVRAADRALEEQYGVTAEMQTFFAREREELPDGAFRVTYTGVAGLEYVLGTYTAVVRDGQAEVVWNHDGRDTSGGYGAECWGSEQLNRMIADSRDPDRKQAYMDRASAAAEEHGAAFVEDLSSSEADEGYFGRREAEKNAAMNARRLSEEEMIGTARDFITGSYGLSEEQTSRLELYTNSFPADPNAWYEMVNGKPCFEVRYLLYTEYAAEQERNGGTRDRAEQDGYYVVWVNVETGAVEECEYNSALGGEG